MDRRFDHELVPHSLTGGPTAVQSILSTFATSLVSLTSLVLTVTLVAVQLAMGQFSPRIVRSLLQDRKNQLAIGLFAAAFAHTILTLREVDDRTGTVPGLSVLLAFLLMGASIVALVLYVAHAGQSLRAVGLIDLVGDNLRQVIEERYPAGRTGPPTDGPDGQVVVALVPGNVVQIDHDGLVAAAREADCVLELVPVMGDFVPAGAPLLRVDGDPSRLDTARVARLVELGSERTHQDDPAYGFRKLVDIAERSIAQPFNDPTTAVQAIHRLHDLLRQLAPRPFPSGRHHDQDGRLRLVVRSITWEGYVRLAFDELRIAGASTPQVPRRLRSALEDLKTVAPPGRQPALDRQLRLLEAVTGRQFEDGEDVAAAVTPDRQGIGSAADLVAVDPPAGDGQPGGDGRAAPAADGQTKVSST